MNWKDNRTTKENITAQFVAGVQSTLSEMFQLKAEELARRESVEADFSSDISGILSPSKSDSCGLFLISFPKKTIRAMVSRFYGRDVEETESSISMAVGEITNIAYGAAKKLINDQNQNLQMAIPSVIVGKQDFVFSNFSGRISSVEFSTELGNFQIFACFREQANPSAS